MKYLCLIYSREGDGPQYGDEDFNAYMGGYFAFTQKVQDEGKYLAGEGLHPVSAATTVSVRDGKTETIDGPFAETKEQLGGFYLLECENIDEALAYAAQIPTATFGRVEVRPVMDYE